MGGDRRGPHELGVGRAADARGRRARAAGRARSRARRIDPAGLSRWAERAGSQAQAFIGDPAWPDQRRFDRAFERLSLPGFGRAALRAAGDLGRLGVFEVRPWSLQLSGDALDPTSWPPSACSASAIRCCCSAARHDLAIGVGVPIEALDLALANWLRPEGERITAGATVGAEGPLRDAIGAALGV